MISAAWQPCHCSGFFLHRTASKGRLTTARDNKPLLKAVVISYVHGYAEEYDWGMHNTELAFQLLAPKNPASS